MFTPDKTPKKFAKSTPKSEKNVWGPASYSKPMAVQFIGS
jgi:hypothetical protein